jgi:hypothetical protein
MGHRQHSDATKLRVKDLWEQDFTATEIAEQLDLTRAQVDGILYRLGVRGKRTQQYANAPKPEHFPDWEVPENVDWREWFAGWDQILELHKRSDPYQQFLTIDYSQATKPIAMASASDLHLGGGFTDHPAIRDTMELVLATDNLFIGLAGDTIEGFIPGVKPAETVEQQVAPVKAQLKALEALTDELLDHDKLWYMSWGDHDAKWFEQTVGVNLVKMMVQHKVPYFVGRATIRLLVGEQEYWLLVNHSERFNSQWNPIHPQRRAYERFFPADVCIAGHKHKPAFSRFVHYEELRRAGFNLGGPSFLVANGTFKTGPDPYTIRGWDRGVIGVPTLAFAPDEHDITIFDSPVKATRWLKGYR